MIAALAVWVLSGLVAKQLWPHFACFVATVYLMVELSNQNALLRIRSRMVTSTFLILTCTSGFLLTSLPAAVVQLCFVAALLPLLFTYQDPYATGRTFFAFAAVGTASLALVHLLWLVPLLWVLMATQLQSLSGRTFVASLLGIATPYWFMFVWLMVPPTDIDLTPLSAHFTQLANVSLQLPSFELIQWLVLLFTVILSAVGIMHFWQRSFEDKIRIRLIYGFLSALTIATLLMTFIMPQHYDILMRLVFIFASPLIAHFFTFTSSRISNIFFLLSLALALAITVFTQS
jgi:hypothetical protein